MEMINERTTGMYNIHVQQAVQQITSGLCYMQTQDQLVSGAEWPDIINIHTSLSMNYHKKDAKKREI